VAKDKTAPRGQYADVVEKLKQVVAALESGELSLEESLDRFGEGIALVKTGESILADAEKRIEKLLSDDGATGPLELDSVAETRLPSTNQLPQKPKAPIKQEPTAPARPLALAPADDEDVPF
jgi:exodeoxyribonuclease VII small subunit